MRNAEEFSGRRPGLARMPWAYRRPGAGAGAARIRPDQVRPRRGTAARRAVLHGATGPAGHHGGDMGTGGAGDIAGGADPGTGAWRANGHRSLAGRAGHRGLAGRAARWRPPRRPVGSRLRGDRGRGRLRRGVRRLWRRGESPGRPWRDDARRGEPGLPLPRPRPDPLGAPGFWRPATAPQGSNPSHSARRCGLCNAFPPQPQGLNPSHSAGGEAGAFCVSSRGEATEGRSPSVIGGV